MDVGELLKISRRFNAAVATAETGVMTTPVATGYRRYVWFMEIGTTTTAENVMNLRAATGGASIREIPVGGYDVVNPYTIGGHPHNICLLLESGEYLYAIADSQPMTLHGMYYDLKA